MYFEFSILNTSLDKISSIPDDIIKEILRLYIETIKSWIQFQKGKAKPFLKEVYIRMQVILGE